MANIVNISDQQKTSSYYAKSIVVGIIKVYPLSLNTPNCRPACLHGATISTISRFCAITSTSSVVFVLQNCHFIGWIFFYFFLSIFWNCKIPHILTSYNVSNLSYTMIYLVGDIQTLGPHTILTTNVVRNKNKTLIKERCWCLIKSLL